MGGVHPRKVLWVAACCSVAIAGAAQPTPVGLWEFDNPSNLSLATLGSNLSPAGAGFSAVSGVDGSDGAVNVGAGSYYTMTHGIAPNGGGAKVNSWSILYDFQIPVGGVWYCFFQTNPANSDDGEYFIRNSDQRIGVGALTYSSFAVTPGTWYRLVVTFSIAGANATYAAYIDGTEINTQTTSSALFVDQRFSMEPTLLLFADENGEDAAMDVSNVAIWGQGLSAADAASLGGAGDPIVPEAPVATAHILVSPGTWVEVGDRVQLTASVAGAIGYEWHKDGELLTEEVASYMVIDPVGLSDAGDYYCRIDTGSKAILQTPPVTVQVFGMGALPATSAFGLGLLAGGIAIGGWFLLRRGRK